MQQLLPLSLVSLGHKGLNKAEASHTNLGMEWAVELQNVIYDDSGRLATRKGWSKTNSAISGNPNIVAMTEFVKADGTTKVIMSGSDNKLYADHITPASITGALTITAPNWQMVNFMDNTYGWQQAHTPWKYTGAGNAAVLVAASGTLPTGNCVCAAFGRLWALDADGFTIKYCGLLDDANWGNAGSGSINMRGIWTKGTDTVQGIYAVGAALVVFGLRHIIVFRDGAPGTNANLGMNPTTMIVSDTIEGTGLMGRDSAQATGEGDLYFLSPTGIQSFARIIVNKNNPIQALDPQIREYVHGYATNETVSSIRSFYSPNDRFYVLILPSTGRDFCYDTRTMNDDGSLRATEWTHIAPLCGLTRTNRDVLLGFSTGSVGQYTGYQDNLTSYNWLYNSPNSAIGPDYENKIKMLKRIKAITFSGGSNTVALSWGLDFLGLNGTVSIPLPGGSVSEYGTAEYGTNGKYNVNDPAAVAGVNYAEYGQNLAIQIIQGSTTGSGRWIQMGCSITINGFAFALQELDVFCKIGNFR